MNFETVFCCDITKCSCIIIIIIIIIITNNAIIIIIDNLFEEASLGEGDPALSQDEEPTDESQGTAVEAPVRAQQLIEF